jgi:hypothetical protein
MVSFRIWFLALLWLLPVFYIALTSRGVVRRGGWVLAALATSYLALLVFLGVQAFAPAHHGEREVAGR